MNFLARLAVRIQEQNYLGHMLGLVSFFVHCSVGATTLVTMALSMTTLSIMTLSIMTLSIMTLSITTLSITTLSIITNKM